MRILSWNINGIRTLPQYHPWNNFKTGSAILDELNADIICFQEMKVQRADLKKHFATPDGYESFFSFPVIKGGYSGVSAYTKTDTVAATKAEEGLTGKLQPKPSFTAEERISPTYPQAHEMKLFPDENGVTPSTLTALDAEGRSLVIDFGLFVLINAYCPAETSDNRIPFKMNFHFMLEERVRKLIHEEGREVIVIGDINITAFPIDHCEGQIPSRQTDFWSHPPRAWFKSWLAPSGPMVDVIRDVWPERKGMYTCWNTKISARDSNYGTRIDYILLTRGLLPWFKHGDIQASIRGSDHCPIYIDLHDEIQLDSGETLRLRDAMRYEEAKMNPPRISARFWDEFKQHLLSAFFTTKASGDTTSSLISTPSSQSTPDILVVKKASQKSEIDVPLSQSEQVEALPDISTPNTSQTSSFAAESSSSLNHATSSGSKSKRKSENSPPVLNSKKRKVGQAKISSFFEKPKANAGNSKPTSKPVGIDEDIDEGTETNREGQIEADEKLARSLSEQTATSIKREGSVTQSKAVWGQLLAPLQPPKCDAHEEPCKQFKVNKPGPNKGKTFFVCSRPVGPGYDKGKTERLREEVDLQYKCKFFKWASDVKREALKENDAGSTNGSTSSSKVTDMEIAPSGYAILPHE